MSEGFGGGAHDGFSNADRGGREPTSGGGLCGCVFFAAILIIGVAMLFFLNGTRLW